MGELGRGGPSEAGAAGGDDRRLSRRGLLHLGGGLGIALLLGPAACAQPGVPQAATASPAAGPTAAPATRDSLTLAVRADPGGWDQDYLAFDLVGLALMKNYYPYLIDYAVTSLNGASIQDTGKVQPVFAESWQADADGKTWTLKLKKGVKFPSGNELTAADVKWSKDRAFAAQANVAGIYRQIGLTKPEQVQVVDDYTVRFQQDFPSALSSQIQVISLYVFDAKEMQKHATADDPWAKAWANANATGGGAYNVRSYQRGSEIVLEANPQFPLGAPPIKTVRVLIVPAAANRRLQLENGDVDIAFDLSRRDIADLKTASNIKVIANPSNEFVFIPLSAAAAPFDNKLVRQAMAYALPYGQIINNVYGGDARRATSPVPLEMPGSNPRGYPYEYNLDRARALLAQAGVADGFTTQLAIEVDNEEQERLAVLIQSELKKLNITVAIEKLDPATFADRRGKKSIPMQIASGQMWVNDVQYLLATGLTKTGFLNYAGYDNARVDQIYDELSKTADQQRRAALIDEVQTILADEVPWLMLAQPNFNLPVRADVAGWVQPVDGLFRLQYLKR